MAKTAMGFGGALIAVGVLGWLLGGASSITGLIPAVFGLILLGLGWWGGRGKEKTAMHIAAVVALLSTLAPLSRILPGLTGGGELGIAFWSNVAMFLVSGTFLALCVKSFIDARRARAALAK